MNILPDGVLQARMDRIVYDDVTNEDIGRRITRVVYTPDMDPATLPAKVRRIANIVWDAATVAAYKAAHPSA
ncbi:hypothetical protein [Mesorhizobium sp. M4B.F.Ca.ET.143.01.1.1]|uniref:hypothetical protein n=1 Tax=Mesorhizobium sp. M4B.F.Ca.ET.143.01.1.1 TaxID=2563947 RepID=UPI00113F8B20|nr:hypothetical protein [Mesorhizobium sp. M4B.F.Ca.ET.143.01.1.1]TGV26326.1 hypothetical protein EN786_12435 [Mesorhizobium sp. M4B.F.Ca.ET.143.01.1.1]